MQYVCDAPDNKIWFRIETEAEAAIESDLMDHAVEKHFRAARAHAIKSYTPQPGRYIEQDIGLQTHLQKAMPAFFTLRDEEGNGLATAMLPPQNRQDRFFKTIIVGPSNTNPFLQHARAIEKLGEHYGLALDRGCYPYRSATGRGL